jgi:hypothetical protein
VGSSSRKAEPEGAGEAGDASEEEEQEEGDEGSLPDKLAPPGRGDGSFHLGRLPGEGEGEQLASGPEGEWGGGRGEDGMSMTSGDESLSQADQGEKHHQADFRWAAGWLVGWGWLAGWLAGWLGLAGAGWGWLSC